MPSSAAKPYATWGVSGTVPDTCVKGIVQEISTDKAGIFAQEPDEKGRVIYQVMYDREDSVSFTLLVPSTSTLPKPGTTVKIGEVDYVVRRVNKIEQNKDFQKIRVESGNWIHCKTCTDQTDEPAA